MPARRMIRSTLPAQAVAGSAREPMDLLNIPNVVQFFDSVSEAFEALEQGAVSPSPIN